MSNFRQDLTVLPVLVRELKSTSKRAGTYWFRTIAAGVGAFLLALILASQTSTPMPSGLPSFFVINVVLVAFTWLFCPLLAADCVSAEKREGTLGLLFLTPLTVRDVIVAKLFTQAWRGGSILLAMVPIISVPLLMGGVSWQLGIFMVAIHLAGLMVALMSGVLASCLGRELNRVRLLACGFGLASAVVFAAMVVEIAEWNRLVGAAAGAMPSFRGDWDAMATSVIVGRYGDALLGIAESLRFPQVAVAKPVGMLRSAALILGGGLFWAFVLLLLAGDALGGSRRERPMTRRQERIWRVFCSPLRWRGILATYMRRKRASNPVAWLDQYSWSARLARWGWCAFFVAVEVWLLRYWNPGTELGRERMMGLLLSTAVGVAAVSSFQHAARSGLLEVLLVTPLREWELIRGRLRAIFDQFLPSAIVMAVVYYTLLPGTVLERGGDLEGVGALDRLSLAWGSVALQCTAVAVVGMAFSLTRANFLVAWAGTCLIVLAGPYVIGMPIWIMGALVGLVDGYGGPFALFWRFLFGVIAGWGIYLLLIYGHSLVAGLLVAAVALVVALIDEGVVGHVVLVGFAQALMGGYALWWLHDRLARRELAMR